MAPARLGLMCIPEAPPKRHGVLDSDMDTVREEGSAGGVPDRTRFPHSFDGETLAVDDWILRVMKCYELP